MRLPDAVLAIENKPFAADQHRQVSDYLAWLDAEVPQGRRCLVYLAGADGAQPSEGSITEADRVLRHAAGELRVISYSGLLPWLARSRGQCQAEPVSAFIDALTRYIQSKFMGARDMTERAQLLQVARRSPDNLHSAFQLIFAADDLRAKLVAELVDQLRTRLPNGFTLARADASASRYTGFGIGMPGVSEVLFTLEFQASNFNWLVYGLRRQGSGGIEEAALQRLKDTMGSGTMNQWWVWWRPTETGGRVPLVQNDWSTNAQPWIDVNDGTLVNRIIAAAQVFHGLLMVA